MPPWGNFQASRSRSRQEGFKGLQAEVPRPWRWMVQVKMMIINSNQLVHTAAEMWLKKNPPRSASEYALPHTSDRKWIAPAPREMLARHVTHAIKCTRKRQRRCVQLSLSSPRTMSDSSSWWLETNTVHMVNYPEATMDLRNKRKKKKILVFSSWGFITSTMAQ